MVHSGAVLVVLIAVPFGGVFGNFGVLAGHSLGVGVGSGLLGDGLGLGDDFGNLGLDALGVAGLAVLRVLGAHAGLVLAGVLADGEAAVRVPELVQFLAGVLAGGALAAGPE